MPNGGYVPENGISVCDECHIKAEVHWNGQGEPDPAFDPDKLYELIGSSWDDAIAASAALGEAS